MSYLQKGKKMTDSNKENITPSSSFKSPGVNYSNFDDAQLKSLLELKESIVSNMELASSENFKLFIAYDDLTKCTIENESHAHKEKTDSENLNDILREKELRNNLIVNNTQESDYWLTNGFLCEMISHNLTSSQSIDYKFKNDLFLNASHSTSKGTSTCNKIYKHISGQHDLLDKDSDSHAMKCFLAFNIV